MGGAGKPVKYHVRKDFLMVLLADPRELAWRWECVIRSWVNPGQGGRGEAPLGWDTRPHDL